MRFQNKRHVCFNDITGRYIFCLSPLSFLKRALFYLKKALLLNIVPNDSSSQLIVWITEGLIHTRLNCGRFDRQIFLTICHLYLLRLSA